MNKISENNPMTPPTLMTENGTTYVVFTQEHFKFFEPKTMSDDVWHGKDLQNGYWTWPDYDDGRFSVYRTYRRRVPADWNWEKHLEEFNKRKEVLPVPESTPYLTSPEISQKKVGATVSSAAGVEELIDAVCYLFGINNQADFVHSNIHSGQMEYAAKQHLAKLSRVEANLNEVAESSNKRIENLEAKLSASERKREELVKAVQANHKWHQENDEYDGYSDSELCEQNLKALAANAESEDSK